MKNKSIPLFSNYSIRVHPHPSPFQLMPEEEDLVEEIWKKEMERQEGHLFNGQLFTALEVTPSLLIGQFIPYKLYIAQLREPKLRQKLSFYPVCITGYTTDGQSILIGKRASYVTQYPGFWELVPSGGIDMHSVQDNKIDLFLQFQIELREEAGIDLGEIERITPKVLEFDSLNRVYEICAEILIHPRPSKSAVYISKEHQELKWISRKNLLEFLAKCSKEFVPFSAKLLKNLFEKS